MGLVIGAMVGVLRMVASIGALVQPATDTGDPAIGVERCRAEDAAGVSLALPRPARDGGCWPERGTDTGQGSLQKKRATHRA